MNTDDKIVLLIQNVINNVSYKPNTQITCTYNLASRRVTVMFVYKTIDARTPYNHTEVPISCTEIIDLRMLNTLNSEQIKEEVMHLVAAIITRAEKHEMYEWLKFYDKHYVDPHRELKQQ